MEGAPLEDLLDVPEFFGDTEYDEDAYEAPSGPPGAFMAGPLASPRVRALLEYPRVKDASVVLPTTPAMLQALDVARQRGDIITSGNEGYPGDGVHAPTSLHYRNLAVDVRFAADVARQIGDYIRAGYHVLREATHLHVSAPSGGAGATRGF